MDFALDEASKRGIRLVLVFANYWSHYGGIDQYNVWSYQAGVGEPPKAFCLVLFQNADLLCTCFQALEMERQQHAGDCIICTSGG